MPDTGTNRWIHPAVILVATDLSDLDRLMPFAFKQAEETGARLILLHVLAAGTGMAVDAEGMPYYDPAGALEFSEKALQPWCDQASRRNIGCDALLREGNAVQQIAAVVRQFQADRILLGSRSRSKLGKLLLGSVAEQVLRSINLPVYTVGPEAHLAVPEADQEQVVLYATTLREASRPSAALARKVAASQGAKLVMMHVLPPLDEMEKKGLTTSQDATVLHELRVLAAEAGCGSCDKVETRVVHGNPTIEILSEASERRASLIMLGASQRSALENLTRDRTIYRVLAHARCPVMTLKEPLLQADEVQTERMATHQ